MEIISFKLDGEIVNKIDSSLKNLNYSNRTEFIRDAIRCKLSQIEKEDIKAKLRANLGALKGKRISNKTDEEIREEVTKEFAKKFNVKLD
jgi:Arc/MetJ-type ribon-helix-helix transcriptional regulator